MHVLLTGAAGNLGREALHALLGAGHRVRTLELDTPRTRKVLEPHTRAVELQWGDILQREHVARAVQGVDAIVHNAAITMPRSELAPEHAERVNVTGTEFLLEAARAQAVRPRFVYASSVSVFGKTQPDSAPPVRADAPTQPSDHYSRHKLRAEQAVQSSGLPWCILRIGVSPPLSPEREDPEHLRFLFAYALESRVEYVHPRDVGFAQASAVSCDEALGKVLLIGGGAHCQITMRTLINGLFERIGVGALPDEAFAREPVFADWLDTEESDRLFAYQRHTLEDALDEVVAQLGARRLALRIARPLVRRFLLKYSRA